MVPRHLLGKDEYLEHHGILGQRWGVRRFQNKDGSLTSAGKKRYSEGESESLVDKVKNTSIDDLRTATSRMQAENAFYQAREQYYSNIMKLKEAEKSAGRKFVEKFVKEQVVPSLTKAATDAAKNYVESKVKEWSGQDKIDNLKSEIEYKSLIKQKMVLDKYFKTNKTE